MKSADRTLDVFEGFAKLGRPATLSELARELDIPVSSCSGLLRRLEERGYLEAVERGTWFPTHRLLHVARTIADHDPLIARVAPVMERLRDATGETVALARRRDTEVVYLAVAESRSAIRYVASAGEVRPLHASSLGRALMSRMPAEARAQLLKRIAFPRLTPKTLTSARAIEAAIDQGRAAGWFANFGESVPDLYAIACPFSAKGGEYALAVIGPGRRIEDNEHRIGTALRKACAALESP